MQNAVAASKDIEYTSAMEREREEFLEKQNDSRRWRTNDLDSAVEDTHPKSRVLLEAASQRQNSVYEDEILHSKDNAVENLFSSLVERQNDVKTLLGSINANSSKGLRDIEVMAALYDFSVAVAHGGDAAAQEVVEQFKIQTAEAASTKDFFTDETYLFKKKFQVFAEGCQSGSLSKNENWHPFEITDGMHAVISGDGDRVYVITQEELEEIKEEIEQFDSLSTEDAGIAQDMNEEDEFYIYERILERGLMVEEIRSDLVKKDPEIMHDYVTALSSDVRGVIEKDFGVDFKDLSIREQMCFVSFLKDVSVQDAETIKEFVSAYGKLGVQAFLSLDELGPQHGWALAGGAMTLKGTRYQQVVEKVFKKFLEMDTMSLQATEYLSSNFNSQDSEAVTKIMLDLRKRAADLLAEMLSGTLDETHIDQTIAQSKADNALFLSSFRTLKERGELNIEEVQDTSFESVSAPHISSADADEMRAILKENWKSEGKTFQEEVTKSLEDAFSSEKSTFYILRHRGQVVGFNRFDDHSDTEDPKVYFGSFNTDPSFGNGKLGEVLYEESLKEQRKKGVPIEAHCNPLSPITQKYIESGFVATAIENYAGVSSFTIVSDERVLSALVTKEWGTEKVIRESLAQDNDNVKVYSVKNTTEIPFEIVNDGFVLSRYFKLENRIYAVFEMPPSAENGAA